MFSVFNTSRTHFFYRFKILSKLIQIFFKNKAINWSTHCKAGFSSWRSMNFHWSLGVRLVWIRLWLKIFFRLLIIVLRHHGLFLSLSNSLLGLSFPSQWKVAFTSRSMVEFDRGSPVLLGEVHGILNANFKISNTNDKAELKDKTFKIIYLLTKSIGIYVWLNLAKIN